MGYREIHYGILWGTPYLNLFVILIICLHDLYFVNCQSYLETAEISFACSDLGGHLQGQPLGRPRPFNRPFDKFTHYVKILFNLHFELFSILFIVLGCCIFSIEMKRLNKRIYTGENKQTI